MAHRSRLTALDRGVAYARLGDRRRAIADYDAALALNPNDGYAY